MPGNHVLTTQQLARRWQLHPQTIHRLRQEGRLTGYQITRQWRYTLEEVERFERENSNDPHGHDNLGSTA